MSFNGRCEKARDVSAALRNEGVKTDQPTPTGSATGAEQASTNDSDPDNTGNVEEEQ